MNSNDSEFTQKYVYTGANGISVVNLSEYVQSELPLKIKITNGATGSLNIHAVGIKTYVGAAEKLNNPICCKLNESRIFDLQMIYVENISIYMNSKV